LGKECDQILPSFKEISVYKNMLRLGLLKFGCFGKLDFFKDKTGTFISGILKISDRVSLYTSPSECHNINKKSKNLPIYIR